MTRMTLLIVIAVKRFLLLIYFFGFAPNCTKCCSVALEVLLVRKDLLLSWCMSGLRDCKKIFLLLMVCFVTDVKWERN